MHKFTTSKIALLAGVVLALCVSVFSPVAHAGAPFSNSGASGSSVYHDPTNQDPQWLTLKYALRIRSGIQPGQGKGAKTSPFVASTAFLPASAPSSYILPTSNNHVLTTFEPGDGCASCNPQHVNFTGLKASYDDARAGYSAGAFFDLCGPGAADITLWYWPNPPNYTNLSGVYDNWDNVATTWDANDVDNITRMRGYMMDLAWDITAPTWSTNGMMNAQPRASAVWLQVVRDAVNWEASGESSNWQNYFYVVTWWNQSSQSSFHSDVVSDISSSQVPLIAEVNAHLMPNWPNNGVHTNHFISIIGYDDTKGLYYYTDTCANITECGSNTNGGLQSVSQSQMWTAITNIQVNQGTGDGGWVW